MDAYQGKDLLLAEKAYKLSVQINDLAYTSGIPSSNVLFWTYGKHEVDWTEEGLNPEEGRLASSLLSIFAAQALVIQLKEFLAPHRDDSSFFEEWSIVRALRNAFAHGPMNPVWKFSDPKEKAGTLFQIAGVLSLDTTNKDGKPVQIMDFGGPIALLRLSEHIRRKVSQS